MRNQSGQHAHWPWDIPKDVTETLTEDGAKRHILYDPGFPQQDNDALWDFNTSPNHKLKDFRVIGYALTFPEAGRVRVENVNPNINLTSLSLGGTNFVINPSERVILADATLSIGANEQRRDLNRYVGIPGGWTKLHQTSHLNGTYPMGGNLSFLDSHVEWRKFDRMLVRTEKNRPDPAFWW
jgi:hypothetical protein